MAAPCGAERAPGGVLAARPPIRVLRAEGFGTRPPGAARDGSACGTRGQAAPCRDRSYICLHLGFFTCGFHIAFLVTHLPGEVGLPVRAAPSGRDRTLADDRRGQHRRQPGRGLGHRARALPDEVDPLLGSTAWRAVAILALPRQLPKTPPRRSYAFGAVLGFTWLAGPSRPPRGLVGQAPFGTRYLATLFGLTLFSHQVGAFFGAWLGGLRARAHRQSYHVDVVRGHGARARGGFREPADPRVDAGAGAEAGLKPADGRRPRPNCRPGSTRINSGSRSRRARRRLPAGACRSPTGCSTRSGRCTPVRCSGSPTSSRPCSRSAMRRSVPTARASRSR